MNTQGCFNAGSIHDIPLRKAVHYSIGGEHFAIFRETFGHFFAFADEVFEKEGPVSLGTIDGEKIRLPLGHTVDLKTGQLDSTDHFVRMFNAWVENGFVFIQYKNPSKEPLGNQEQNRITEYMT